jgi:adenylyl-sulfate kinase
MRNSAPMTRLPAPASAAPATPKGAPGDGGGFCLWLTGLPSAGKTTIANELSRRLRGLGRTTEVLDGDEVRKWLSADLGFDRASRDAQAARVSSLAKFLVDQGGIPIVSLISPYRSSRARARFRIGRFVEVYVTTPLHVCERRDVKGLYRKARSGELRGMTGIDDPYEPPMSPEIAVDAHQLTLEESAAHVLEQLEWLGWLHSPKVPLSRSSRSAQARAAIT